MPIDKSQLYGMFQRSLKRSEKLNDLATRKALDLPLDDEMQIITNHTHRGLGRWGTLLLSLAMLAGGGGATLGTGAALGWFERAIQPPPQTTPPDEAAAREFKVTFWTEDGQPLAVEDDIAN